MKLPKIVRSQLLPFGRVWTLKEVIVNENYLFFFLLLLQFFIEKYTGK